MPVILSILITTDPPPWLTEVFEKWILNQLSQHLNDSHSLSPYQSGFRPNFSTTTALLKFTNDVSSSLDNNIRIGEIFIDFTKAFDYSHYLLLHKLSAKTLTALV